MGNTKRDIEVEATCLAWEQCGAHLAGDRKGAVAMWMQDASILASDGVAKSGKLDRLGRPFGKGRGCGLFDLVIPCEVVPGSIVEQVPAAVKGCKSSGYGNRDLTQHHEVAVAHAMAGRPIWTFLVRQIGETVVMRRIDAARFAGGRLAAGAGSHHSADTGDSAGIRNSHFHRYQQVGGHASGGGCRRKHHQQYLGPAAGGFAAGRSGSRGAGLFDAHAGFAREHAKRAEL